MNWTYTCPHCKALLNPRESIILLGTRGSHTHLVGFHPVPGNYEIYFPPSARVVEGDRWDFACPVCRHDLVTAFSENLCAIDIQTTNESHRVFFSRIAGDQATFVVADGGVRSRHGKDADRYNAEMAQMKYLL